MDMITPMQPKPLVDATCKLGEKGCFKDGRCHALGDCENKIVTNADHIRSMADEELAEFLMSDICGRVSPKDFDCYGACVDCAANWLKQPYKEEV